MKKCLVSIDRLTNEIEAMPVDKIYIKPKVANISLDMQAIGILKNGGMIREQHVELPNGAKFTADLQYNAAKRDIVFVNSDVYRQKQEQNSSQQQQSKSGIHGTIPTAPSSASNTGASCRLTNSSRPITSQARKSS